MIGLQFRDQVTRIAQSVADEFEQLAAGVSGFLSGEHHDDGTHSDVTADSVVADVVTVREAESDPAGATGRFVLQGRGGQNGLVESDIRTEQDPEGYGATHALRVDTDGQEIHLDTSLGRAVSLNVRSSVSAAIEQRFRSALAALGSLRFVGQSSYTPSPGDTSAFADAADGPAYSAYRLTPSGHVTIDGIYADLSAGNRGQTLVVWNDSAYVATFTSVVISNRRKILGDPVSIGPQGTIVFVYDTTGQGWRIIAHTFGDSAAYTPAWTSDGTQPAIGNGSITGHWRQEGGTVQYDITVVMGSGSTYGTGGYLFSLPTTTVTGGPMPAGSAVLVDAGVLYYLATPVHDGSGTKVFLLTVAGVGVSASSPFAFGDSDGIRIQGSYARR